MKKILLGAAMFASVAASAQTKKISSTTTTTTKTTTMPVPSNSGTANSDKPTIIESSPAPSARSSQEMPQGDGGIKVAAGEITMEANVNILGGNVNLSNALQQVRGRYFLSDDMAARLGVNLNFTTNNPTNDTKTRAVELSIAPGVEKHFAGTNRLSPYVGAELLFGYKSTHSETNGPGNAKVEIKGSYGPTDNANRGYFLVGLGGVAGFDFYVARHLYLGYELNLELSNRSFSDIEVTTTSTTGIVETKKYNGSSSLYFGPNVRNGIRVGFVF